MIVGDLVKARQLSLHGWNDIGIVVTVVGRKWLKIAWADGIIQREHVSDLELLSEA